MKRILGLFAFLVVLQIFPALASAQDDGVRGFSFTTIGSTNVVSECATEMGANVASNYPGVGINCDMNGIFMQADNCTGLTSTGFYTPTIFCSQDFIIVSGTQYTTSASHLLNFLLVQVDPDVFEDLFDYEDAGTRECDDQCTEFGANLGDNLTGHSGFFVETTSDSVTTPAITITPSSVTLNGSSQTQSFTADVAAKWSVLPVNPNPNPNPGSVSPASGTSVTYTGPANLGQEETVEVQACDQNNSSKCASATVNLVPITVTISPSSAAVIPGLTQAFSATVNGTSNQAVTWSVTSTGAVKGTIDSTGVYTAPTQDKLAGATVTDTVKACSNAESARCDQVQVTVAPVKVTVSGTTPFLANPGATDQFAASYSGLPPFASTATTWAVTTPGTIDQTGLYTAPSTLVTAQTNVNVTACLSATSGLPAVSQICGVEVVTLSPPVAVTGVSGTLFSGQSNIVTINGSGFGTGATVLFPDASFVASGTPTNTSIPGVLTIPSLASPFTPQMSVTSTSNPINSTGTLLVTYTPVTVSVSLFPGNASLEETQSQTFSATVSCKTAGNNTCTIPQTVTCSVTPNLGMVSLGAVTACQYTASSTVTGAQSVPVQLKAVSTFATSASATASITLIPLNVTVNPATVSLNGGQTKQFMVSLSGATGLAQTVKWSVVKQNPTDPPPVGSVDVNGVYTAPATIAAAQTVGVQACTTIDPNVCNVGLVTLVPITVTVSPTTASLNPSQTQQFTATVAGTSTTTVNWTIVPANLGSINNAGLYTAPPPPNDNQQTVTVKACTTITPQPPNPCGTATVTLLPSPDFSVTVAAVQPVTPGATASYTVVVAPLNGFTGTVTFGNCPVTPPEPTITITGCPNSVTISSGSQSFPITAATTLATPLKNYNIGVTGSALGFPHSASPGLDVVDFAISASPATASASGGGNPTFQVSTTALNSFNYPVCLAVTGGPTGVTPTFSPLCITGTGNSTLTLPISNTTQTGNFTLIITGTSTAGGSTDVHTVTPSPTLTVAPSVTTLSLSTGPVNTSVTITGTNFGTTQTQGNGTVAFGSVQAPITNWSNTSITVTVPPTVPAGSQPVVVTVNNIPSNNNVNFVVVPAITGVSLSTGPVNTPVTITGTSFGGSQNTSTVTFGGVPATSTTNWSDGSVTVLVPATLTVGTYPIVVTVNGAASNPPGVTPPNFTVIPGILSITPSPAPTGTVVTITGTNFGGSQGTSTLTFNGTAAAPTNWTNTSIQTPVPSGLQPGPGTVVLTNGLPSNPAPFTVAPAITSVNPPYSAVNGSVVINGTSFGTTQGNATVTFNGVTAPIGTWSNGAVSVSVPTGATTGPIVVTAGSVASGGTPFTIISPATYFLTTASSSTSGQMQLSPMLTSAGTVASPDLNGEPAGEYLIEAFDTQAGVPDSTATWPAGLSASFTLWMQQTAGTTGTLFPDVKLFLNSLSGTPICSAFGSTALTTTNTQYTLTCAPANNITLASTDRYYLWVGVDSNAAVTTSTTVQIGVGVQLRGRPAAAVTVPMK